MSDPSENANPMVLASRCLHALQYINRILYANPMHPSFGHLTLSQVTILQLVYDTPGISAADVANRLNLDSATAMKLISALEREGLLTLSRPTRDGPPNLRSGALGQRVAFQLQAAQLSAISELLGRLTDSERRAVVEALEMITALRPE